MSTARPARSFTRARSSRPTSTPCARPTIRPSSCPRHTSARRVQRDLQRLTRAQRDDFKAARRLFGEGLRGERFHPEPARQARPKRAGRLGDELGARRTSDLRVRGGAPPRRGARDLAARRHPPGARRPIDAPPDGDSAPSYPGFGAAVSPAGPHHSPPAAHRTPWGKGVPRGMRPAALRVLARARYPILSE